MFFYLLKATPNQDATSASLQISLTNRENRKKYLETLCVSLGYCLPSKTELFYVWSVLRAKHVQVSWFDALDILEPKRRLSQHNFLEAATSAFHIEVVYQIRKLWK